MELKVPSPKLADLSPSDCNSDPEEKEISDEDDDDRNHKHRRRDTRSQSLERDTPDDTVSAKPFRKQNKPIMNGNNHFRENDSQGGPNWKPYNPNNPANSFPGKFDRRRPPGHASTARSPLDLNHRFRPNHVFSGDPGLARGRIRDLGLWNHDSRFIPDLASQVAQGSIPPGMFPGRGLPNVSNRPNASWNAFGIIPGIPNGGLDAMHSMGLQGPLRPPMPAALNMGIQLQRCRDFEERGFCLRGDMCPMEHGVNRIVIEDVQSLSQFNLPASLPTAHILGPSSGAGPGSLSSMNSSSVPPMNSKGLHSKTSKTTFADDGLGMNGSYPSSASVAGADLYDPDQPLWNNNGPETSNTVLGIHSNKIEDAESLPNGNPSDNEFPVRGAGNTAGPNATSVWGRIHNSKGKPDVKEKLDLAASSSNHFQNESKGDKVAANSSRQGKRVVKEDASSDPSAKSQFDAVHSPRKPTKKATRTLFVNGVPLKNNKRESLLSHFQKFGEVIDIYIPANTERAFVQFSKREEAEEALKAPDAVMGNRFIKLWWANRDSIADDSTVTSNPLGVSAVSVPPHSFFASSKRENLQAAEPKSSAVRSQEVAVSENSTKPVLTNGPKVVPPTQKKLDNLEQLKEELRKKQELLEQKRNEFKRKLVKLEKQATGSKGESEAEQVSKKPKLGIAEDAIETTPRSSDSVPAVKSTHADKSKSGENVLSHSPKANATVESSSSKQHQIRPFAASGPPFLMNRYKLDNRPTAFRILPPLPAGFANVAAVKEHLLPYGEISSVELEDDVEASSGADPSKDCSARVSFVTRRSSERAFVTGRCWQGHNLNFAWLNNPPSSETSSRENKGSSEPGDAKPEEKVEVASSENVVELEEDEGKRSAEEEDTEDSWVLNRSPSPTTMSGSREPNEDGDTC